MGGNLFKLGRLPKAQYQVLEAEIKQYLQKKLPNQYYIPRYYADKADFGDIDVIVSIADKKTDWRNLKNDIISDLNLQESKSTGAIFSTVYKDFQVDYFCVAPKYLESTYHYLSFNDIGNLIGKIFKRFNLKYGEKGLEYVFRRADNHYKKEISISRDFEKIYRFLGLDYEQWQKGFQSRTEMFEWIIASPYFSVVPYQKMSANTTKRARHRATMQRFLAYLDTENITKTYEFLEDKDDYLPFIDTEFPEAKLLAKIAKEQGQEKYVIALKTKYNGKIIMDLLPHLKGKDLGKFMANFQAQFKDYEQALSKMTREEIAEKIVSFSQ